MATQPSPLLPPGHAHYTHAAHPVATTTWPSPLPQIAPHAYPTNCGHMTPEHADPTNCSCTHGYAHYAQATASPDYALSSGFPPEDAHHHAKYALASGIRLWLRGHFPYPASRPSYLSHTGLPDYALWRISHGYTAIPKITPTTPGLPLPQNTPITPKPFLVLNAFSSRLSFPECDDILRCHSVNNFRRTISDWHVRPWITITNTNFVKVSVPFVDTYIAIFPLAVSP